MSRPALQQLLSSDPGLVSGAATETRLIAMGSAPLAEGFGLIGFEILPDATIEELDEVLSALLKQRQKALVLVEDYLARGDSPALTRVRMEGGRIVVVEIPRLNAPGDYHPQVEDMILSILGPTALEERV
jgi:vacuolar-type H+-ATPase subunit F/Vma7